MLDTSEITVQHDKLKQMLDHAVQDTIGAAMKVVTLRLEALFKIYLRSNLTGLNRGCMILNKSRHRSLESE